MKISFLGMALSAAISALVLAPAAHADPGPATSSSGISMNIPPSIIFASNTISYPLTDPTTNATGKSITGYLETNYHTVSLQVKASQAGTTRTTASGVILATDITVTNGSTSVVLSTTNASLGTLTGFVPNVVKTYTFPASINNVTNYEQGNYSNTIVFTATGS